MSLLLLAGEEREAMQRRSPACAVDALSRSGLAVPKVQQLRCSADSNDSVRTHGG